MWERGGAQKEDELREGRQRRHCWPSEESKGKGGSRSGRRRAGEGAAMQGQLHLRLGASPASSENSSAFPPAVLAAGTTEALLPFYGKKNPDLQREAGPEPAALGQAQTWGLGWDRAGWVRLLLTGCLTIYEEWAEVRVTGPWESQSCQWAPRGLWFTISLFSRGN